MGTGHIAGLRDWRGRKRKKGKGCLTHTKRTNGGMMMKHFGVSAFLLIIFLLWNTPAVNAQFSEAGVEQFKVAVNAPDFKLRKLGGGEISFKDLKGKVIILNFFATY